VADFEIPDDLIKLVRDRRVIPFVGAGLSTCMGLPGWTDLLRKVASDLRVTEDEPALTYEALQKASNGDFLRIAEYLYIRAGSNIGPLRLSMTNALQTTESVVSSTPHVELLNLGAPQVYTTNFDDLIESTYRELHQPVEVVALPRDVATAEGKHTEVVKYHGDLRYDNTLVLTESAYYQRLDFESPMDLKFRSDLLGKSVLFIGYSFSDINIRVIWFKLMQMMRDVPKEDRPPSYIVRLEPNPVLEALFGDVGLRTILLDPESKANTQAKKTELLGTFLTSLASAASPSAIPGTGRPMFASSGLLQELKRGLNESEEEDPFRVPPVQGLYLLSQRDVPPLLRGEALDVLSLTARSNVNYLMYQRQLLPRLINWSHEIWGPVAPATVLAARALISGGGRRTLLDSDTIDWSKIWGVDLASEDSQALLRLVERELNGHESGRFLDDDVAYGLDLAVRLARGLTSDTQQQAEALGIIDQAANLYPAVKDYEPSPDGPPAPAAILEEIQARRPPQTEAESDEIPF
jgi:hypothetical protein